MTGEVLRRDGQDPPTYRIAAVEEEKQRLDVVAVRVPTKAILGLAAAVAERLTQKPARTRRPKPRQEVTRLKCLAAKARRASSCQSAPRLLRQRITDARSESRLR